MLVSIKKLGVGDWGLGVGSWGMGVGEWGIGPNPQSPIPNPQSPIPNPHIMIIYFHNFTYLIVFLNIEYYLISLK